MDREISTSGINLAYLKWQKEKRYNPSSEFNVIKVLSSYNEVLYKKNINTEKDQIYYNFIQKIGRYIPKQSTKDDWIQYCQKLFQAKLQQNQNEEYQINKQRSISNIQMNTYYNDRLMKKTFVVWFHQTQQKNQNNTRKQNNISLIKQQDVFIPEEDSYIQYKRNKYQKNMNALSDYESSPKQNIRSQKQNRSQQRDNQNIKSSCLNSTPTKDYSIFNSNQSKKQFKNKDHTSLSWEYNNEYKKQIHFESVRQFTDMETIDNQQRKNIDNYQQNQQLKSLSQNSPSYCPLRSTNSFAIQNLVISPNSSIRNRQNKQHRNPNQESFRQNKETIQINDEKQGSQRQNTNTFRNIIFNNSIKNQINNNKETKILINSMYDNLDIFETNMDELGENAINLTKISADFEASCIYKGKDNTKFFDESYSFHQNLTKNNIFQTCQEDVQTNELSFNQQDFQSTMPNYTQKSCFGDNHLKQQLYSTQSTTKNLTTITPRNQTISSNNNLDFKILKENIKTMSLYFSKLQLYKEKQKKKKLILPQKLNLEQEANRYYIRQLKYKVFCLLKAFCIVSGETQERYNDIKNNNESRIKRKYLHRFIYKYNQRVQRKAQDDYIQNNIEMSLLNKAFLSLKKYHEYQQLKQMQANQLIFTSRTSIDFIIDLYLQSQLSQQYHHIKIHDLFQNCSKNMNYKPLITSLVKNQIISEKSSKLLSNKTNNVIMTIKQNCFQVLKSLYDRNIQATNLYNLKKVQKTFNILKNFSNERIQLKEGLEKFISCKLQLNYDTIILYQFNSFTYNFLFNQRYSNIANVLFEWKRVTAQKRYLKNKGQIVFNKYRTKQTKEFISQWIQNFNLSQVEKQKILKSNVQYFQVVCRKVFVELKKSQLIGKQKRLMNEVAYQNTKYKTQQFFFDIMTAFYNKQKIERLKIQKIQSKRNMLTLKQSLAFWKLERFYSRIITQFRLNNFFTKFIQACDIERDISEEYNQRVERFQKKRMQNKKKQILLVLLNKDSLSIQNYCDAFSFHYNKLLQKGLNAFKINKDLIIQKYSTVYEYLSNIKIIS